MPLTVALNPREIDLLTEALTARASRHESMARAAPQNAGPHERTAKAMLDLRNRLNRLRFPPKVPA